MTSLPKNTQNGSSDKKVHFLYLGFLFPVFIGILAFLYLWDYIRVIFAVGNFFHIFLTSYNEFIRDKEINLRDKIVTVDENNINFVA